MTNSGQNVLNNEWNPLDSGPSVWNPLDSGPSVWNVEFVDNAVVLKKGSQFIGHDSKNPTNEAIYMLNDEHKTPFKMYFLGTFNEWKAMDLKLKYNESL